MLLVQLWIALGWCSPQDLFCLHSGEELQKSSWWRRPTHVCPSERMRSSGCSSAIEASSTSTHLASDLGNVTFTGEQWRRPGHTTSHRCLCCQENWRWRPETDVTSLRTHWLCCCTLSDVSVNKTFVSTATVKWFKSLHPNNLPF